MWRPLVVGAGTVAAMRFPEACQVPLAAWPGPGVPADGARPPVTPQLDALVACLPASACFCLLLSFFFETNAFCFLLVFPIPMAAAL